VRVRVPTNAVRLNFARTNEGGPVTVRFADDEQVIDGYSAGPGQGGDITLMRRNPVQNRALPIKVRLPRYTISSMRLAWEASAGGKVQIDRALARWRVFGIEVRRHNLELGESMMTAPGFSAPVSTGPGAIVMEAPPGLGPLGHAVGLLMTFAGLGVLLLAALALRRAAWAGTPWPVRAVALAVAGLVGRMGAAIRATRLGMSRWLNPFVLACAVVVGVRVWMCAWAPLLYPPDAMDYLRETITFLKTGHLEHTGIRVLGLSVYFAPFWKLFDDFNFAVGVGNAVLGGLTAVMAGLTARRLMPRPLDAVVVLVVGLSPVLLAWERFGMSETPAAFFVMLTMWLTMRAGRWSVAEGPLRIALPGAALIGLIIVAGAYTRLNLQVLAVFVPAAAFAAAWPRRGFLRAGLVAAVIAGTAFAGFVPRMITVRREYGRFAFSVGTEYAAGLLGWYSGLVDVNQTAVSDFATTRQLLAERSGGRHDVRL